MAGELPCDFDVLIDAAQLLRIHGQRLCRRSLRSVPSSAKVVVVHKGLADFARKQAPNAVVISFSQFLNDPIFDKLVQALKSGDEIMEAR